MWPSGKGERNSGCGGGSLAGVTPWPEWMSFKVKSGSPTNNFTTSREGPALEQSAASQLIAR